MDSFKLLFYSNFPCQISTLIWICTLNRKSIKECYRHINCFVGIWNSFASFSVALVALCLWAKSRTLVFPWDWTHCHLSLFWKNKFSSGRENIWKLFCRYRSICTRKHYMWKSACHIFPNGGHPLWFAFLD